MSTNPPLTRGQLRLGVSTEYIEQDTAWVGYHSVEVGAVPRPDHNEVSTTNLTWKVTTELALSQRWSASLLLPIVHREHLHLASEEGEGEPVTIGDATGTPERWNFTALGDLQLAARYAVLPAVEATDTELSVFAGLKLPTGSTNQRNDEGEQAEITLQPGTGSVDPLAGVAVRRRFAVTNLLGAAADLPAFAGITAHAPGSDGRFGYRPGTELLFNAGVAYPLTPRLQALGQINYRYKDRDHVGDAPGVPREHTGGEQLFLSPGVEIGLNKQFALYSYVQVPVLQRVNGIQLVSRWNLLIGLTVQVDNIFEGDL